MSVVPTIIKYDQHQEQSNDLANSLSSVAYLSVPKYK
jgi:hypothetical protein